MQDILKRTLELVQDGWSFSVASRTAGLLQDESMELSLLNNDLRKARDLHLSKIGRGRSLHLFRMKCAEIDRIHNEAAKDNFLNCPANLKVLEPIYKAKS